MKCPKCNSNIIVTIEGSNNIVRCENCDYEVVTTYIPLIKFDETIYRLTILNNEGTVSQVKAVSKSLGCNFVDSKKILVQGNYTYEALASDIIDKKKLLDEASVLYKIEPEFKY